MKPTIHIQIEYPVFFPCSVGGHTSVLATIRCVSFGQSECASIWTDPECKGIIAPSSTHSPITGLDYCEIFVHAASIT